LTTIDGVRVMNQHEDEHEHSGEMQLPYIAYCCQQQGRGGQEPQVTVTPVMIGSLTTQDETQIGRALSAIMKRPDVITIVSTDFCHWGQRFRFQPLPLTSSSTATAAMPIHQFIEALDRRGMDLIAAQQPGAFAEYLRETRNTICGRHPIAVWLRGLEKVQEDHHHHRAAPEGCGDDEGVSIRFTWYAQSSAVQRPDESSVSYAAAIAVQEDR
jgi:MEMO1 family protein